MFRLLVNRTGRSSYRAITRATSSQAAPMSFFSSKFNTRVVQQFVEMPGVNRPVEVFEVPRSSNSSNADASTSSSDASPYTVVVVPGNPGCGAYYFKHMEALDELLLGKPRIVSVSLKDHEWDGRYKELGAAQSLAGQVEYFKTVFTALSDKGRRKLIIVGHSIGAYIAMKAVDRMTPEEARSVAHIAGVMPFLATDLSGGQKPVWRLSSAANLLWGVFALIGFLPRFLLYHFVRLSDGGILEEKKRGLEPYAIDVTVDLFKQPAGVQAYKSFTLAKTEFDTLMAPDWEMVRRLSDKMSVFYCDGDFWTPGWVVDYIRENVRQVPLVRLGKASHAFCTRADESTAVAFEVVEQLKRSLPSLVRSDSVASERDRQLEGAMQAVKPGQNEFMM